MTLPLHRQSSSEQIEDAARKLMKELDANLCKPGWYGFEWDDTRKARERLARLLLDRESGSND